MKLIKRLIWKLKKPGTTDGVAWDMNIIKQWGDELRSADEIIFWR